MDKLIPESQTLIPAMAREVIRQRDKINEVASKNPPEINDAVKAYIHEQLKLMLQHILAHALV